MPSSTLELKNSIVRAGAGAGKTTELTKRVLNMAEDFLKNENRLPHLIVTTFTRKATQELKERLMLEALKRKDARLEDFLQKPSCLHISTIHGVLGLFLARYASEVGLNPKFEIISEDQERRLLKRVLRELSREKTEVGQFLEEVLEELSSRQLIEALKDYAESKAFKVSMQPVDQKRFDKLRNSCAGKFAIKAHEFADHIFAEVEGKEEKWIAYATALKNLTSDNFFEKFEAAAALGAGLRAKNVSDDFKQAREILGKVKEKVQGFGWTKQAAEIHEASAQAFYQLAEEFFKRLWHEKLAQGRISMSDMESLALILIQNSPASAASFSKDWDFWLIDEFQDTSPRQVALLRELIGQAKSFKVGDPQQSIYLFRGARSEVFAEAEDEVKKVAGELTEKRVNYRSREELLNFFNDFFTRLSPQFSKMSVGKDQNEPAKEKFQADFTFCIGDAVDSEQQAALARIQELHSQGVAYEDIAVLSRRHLDLELMAAASQKALLPIHVHASSQFFSRREVQDGLSLLRFLMNPHDNINLIALLRSPWLFIPDEEIMKVCDRHQQSYWWAIQHSKLAQSPSIELMSQALNLSRSRGVISVWKDLILSSEMLRSSHAIDTSGRREANLWKLISWVAEQERSPGFNLNELFHNLEMAESSEETSGEGDATPVKEPKRVNLMTIHASKGLQFKYVLLLGCGKYKSRGEKDWLTINEDTGEFALKVTNPESGKKEFLGPISLWTDRYQLREQEEYDRQLYVALTRAEEGVTLISSRVDKGSWAIRFPINQTPGEHQGEGYQYRVRIGEFQVAQGFHFEDEKLNLIQPLSLIDSKTARTISVTEALEQKTHSAQSDTKQDLAPLKKALRGTEIHRYFENVQYMGAEAVEKSLSPELKKAFRYTLEAENGLFHHLMKQGFVEWGFGAKLDASVIQGQIDLWGRGEDGKVWIVDYKTGSDRYQEKAFTQLTLYRWALILLGQIKPQDEVHLAVIYPLDGKVYKQKAPSFEEAQEIVRQLIQN